MSICRVSFAIAALQTDTFPFHSSLEDFTESKKEKKEKIANPHGLHHLIPKNHAFSVSDGGVMVLITLDYSNLPVPPCGAA